MIFSGNIEGDAARLKKALADMRAFAVESFRSFLGTRGAFRGVFFALLPAGAMSLGLALQSNLGVEFGMNDDDDDSTSGVSKLIYLNDAAKRDVRMAEAPRIGGVWVAGSPPSKFPEGEGQSLAAGELFSFNMHYHPSGNAGADRSKLGIYFGQGELKKEVTTAFAADPGMYIPAGAADHRGGQ